ncbi:MAG: c-type cytochrome, partial [Gemmataceae bacterium]
RKVSHQEIAQGREKIICFAEDRQGEIYWLDYQEKDGGIYTLSANTRPGHDPAAFPRKLSDTGIFSSVSRHEPAVGVVSYRIQAEPWMDGASAERLIAVPGNGMVKVYDEPQPIPGAAWFRTRYFFPKDTVLVKTMGFASEGSQRSDRRRIETQLMHFDGNDWRGYTYRWNAGGTDADLVPATGDEKELTNGDVSSPGGTHKQTWTFHGRGACLQCHNPWAGTLLGFTLEQLDRPAGSENQLAEWSRIGLMSSVDNKGQPHNPPKPLKASTPYYSPQDSHRDLNARARMYLQINCAHCHQSAAGGTALIDLRLSMRPEELRAIDQPSTQGTFGIPGGRLLAPGDPYRSIMLYRMAKNGSGRMPHIGSDVVDRTGYALLHDWVSSLPGKQNHSTTDEEAKCLERFRQPAGDASDRARDLDRLLSSPSGAMRLAWALDNQQIPASQRPMLVEKGANHPEVTVRDLFERFLPGDRRIKRLGTLIRPENILVLKGDPKRGEALFFQPGATQCVNCHRIGNKGGAIGPELSGIGKKYPRAKILETILEPSREIDKNHAAYVLETTAGQVLTGLIIKRGATGILLRDAQGKEHSFATSQIEQVTASKKSLMPEQLLRDLTAQQAADLLEFLCQQK